MYNNDCKYKSKEHLDLLQNQAQGNLDIKQKAEQYDKRRIHNFLHDIR